MNTFAYVNHQLFVKGRCVYSNRFCTNIEDAIVCYKIDASIKTEIKQPGK